MIGLGPGGSVAWLRISPIVPYTTCGARPAGGRRFDPTPEGAARPAVVCTRRFLAGSAALPDWTERSPGPFSKRIGVFAGRLSGALTAFSQHRASAAPQGLRPEEVTRGENDDDCRRGDRAAPARRRRGQPPRPGDPGNSASPTSR